jgi:hypothetical protein
MATKKSVSADEKFQQQDFDLFDALLALDKKDYSYYDRLTEEQQKKFVPYMMTHWMSQVKANGGLQGYYVRSVEYHANQHMFNEHIQKHPKLQWLMLCASSPDLGKQFHQWIPHLSERVGKLKDTVKQKEIREFFQKIYPKTNSADIDLISQAFVKEQNKKVYLSKQYPELKYSDIEVLAELVTDDDIQKYEEDRGN